MAFNRFLTAALTDAPVTVYGDGLQTRDFTYVDDIVAALVRADERLHDSFQTITLPLLILHGSEDRATVCRGSQFFHEKAGSADKTLRIYDGHYHDLLSDIGKEVVMTDILGWLEARLPARTAAG